jgi:hypothetical protein
MGPFLILSTTSMERGTKQTNQPGSSSVVKKLELSHFSRRLLTPPCLPFMALRLQPAERVPETRSRYWSSGRPHPDDGVTGEGMAQALEPLLHGTHHLGPSCREDCLYTASLQRDSFVNAPICFCGLATSEGDMDIFMDVVAETS